MDWVRLGILIGIVTGLLEVCARIVAWFGFGRPFYRVGWYMLWTIPATDAAIFGAAGLLVAVAARWGGRRFTQIMLVGLIAAAVYAMLFNYPSLQWIARAALSLGVGIQLGLILAAHSAAFRRFLKRMTIPAAVVIALIAATFALKDIVVERRALAALGPPPAVGSPNVLLIVLDAVRAQDMSLYGYQRQTTPHLDRLAKSSVVFDNAVSTAPWTLPSHASMFTGRYPHEMSADWEVPLDDRYPTLAEILRARGYLTGGFAANQLFGLREFGLGRGFVHYVSRHLNIPGIMESSAFVSRVVVRYNQFTHTYERPNRRDAANINRNLLAWLPKKSDRPFFVFVNYFDAHEPYTPPAPYDMKFLKAEPPTRTGRDVHFNKVETQGMQDAYDGSVAYVDLQLDSLLRELDRRGQLANTLLIVTADHGEEFGEHTWVGHGNGLYLPALHVPLLIRFPGHVPAGIRITPRVTLRDLAATVLGMLNVNRSVALPGQSLATAWQVSTIAPSRPASPLLDEVNHARNTPDWYAIARGDMHSIIVGGYQYILNGDGREELYNVDSDPWESKDLMHSPADSTHLRPAREGLKKALEVGAWVSGKKVKWPATQ